MENKLPKNWLECSIGEIVSSKRGRKPSSTIDYQKDGYIPYILIDEMEGKPIRSYTNDPKVSIVNEKDVLIVWDGSIGKCGSGINGAIGSTLVALTPMAEIPTKFVEYLLIDKNSFIKQTSTGTGLQHINKNFFEICRLNLPPLAEQNRIVAKLDALFVQLETIKASMAKVPLLLKDFRQQVLTQAVTGKLTEEWRKGKSLNALKTLDEIKIKRNILLSKRDNKESGFDNPSKIIIPIEWQSVELWDLSYVVTSGSRDWSKYYSDKGAFFVRSAEINNNKLRLDEAIKVNLPEKIEGKRSLIEKGNLLITITGANVGKCALIEEEIPESYVSQSVAIVKIVDSSISKYVHLTLLSRNLEGSQLENMAYGMGRPVLSLPQIKSVKIPFPSFEEQQEIVSRVESLFAKADAIENQYETLKAKIDSLPQAILHKAFKGELTEQLDTDGDARELLREIEGLKEQTAKASKKKKVKV